MAAPPPKMAMTCTLRWALLRSTRGRTAAARRTGRCAAGAKVEREDSMVAMVLVGLNKRVLMGEMRWE